MRSLSLALFALVLVWSQVALAQPGLNSPGGPSSHAPQHAVPPMPYSMQSPMPSLPPPLAMGSEEPLPPTAGSLIQRPGYDAHILEDGRLAIDDRFLRTGLSNDPITGPRAGASFDVGDTLMRLFTDKPGLDPYLSDKLDLLHETFAQRVELRREYNKQTMGRALDALPQYLSAVWDAPGWDLPTKRRILFALWDECAEDGDAQIVDGGHAARNTITTFIGQWLPEGSEHGYTNDELSGFNQMRTSRLAFAPPAPNL
jgi:hypothetical protein